MRLQTLSVNIWSFQALALIYTTPDLLNPDNTTDSEFDKIWGQYSTVPLFLILILFPLVNLKSATFFTKFNALGILRSVSNEEINCLSQEPSPSCSSSPLSCSGAMNGELTSTSLIKHPRSTFRLSSQLFLVLPVGSTTANTLIK